jgi:hypothetical protein
MPKPMLLALVLAIGSTARATVIVPAEFREVVAGSEIIAYGRVMDVRPEWSADRRHITSHVTFAVGTYLKGGADTTITFSVPGGEIGRYRSIMAGAPVFAAGDEAVLFLKSGGGTPIIFGFNQGVFRVRTDAATGRRMVVSPALSARGDPPEPLARGSSERRSVPLEAFAARVKDIMAELQGTAR